MIILKLTDEEHKLLCEALIEALHTMENSGNEGCNDHAGMELLLASIRLPGGSNVVVPFEQCNHPDKFVERDKNPIPSGAGDGCFYVEYCCPRCGGTKTDVERSNREISTPGKWFPPER